MKALVLRQPWAWLVVHGIKDVENRSWRTDYRGPLIIVAGASTADLPSVPDAQKLAGRIALPAAFERGGIVGYVTVVGMSLPRRHRSRWAWGPWCWDLEDAHTLPFIPFKGRLGLFDIPGDTIEEIVEKLSGHRG